MARSFRRRPLAGAALALQFAVGCASAVHPPTSPGTAREQAVDPGLLAEAAGKLSRGQDYRLAPQDLVTISVYQEPDLTRDTRLSETGRISFPLIGEVELAGLSAMEAETRLRDRLRGYFVDPGVSVTIKEYHSRKIVVLGEVERPGSYDIPSEHPLTAVGAIALAGGFNKFAAPNRTRIVRKVGAGFQTITVPVADVTSGDKSKDVVLQTEDVLFVPQTMF